MLTRRSCLALLALGVLCSSSLQAQTPTAPAAAVEPKVRIFMVSQSMSFTHTPVKRQAGQLSVAEVAMRQLAQQEGYKIEFTQDVAADFTKENLDKYNIVAFYTQGYLPIKPEALDYFLSDWLKKKGNGFIGFHSASDTLHDARNKEKSEAARKYWEMVGGSFKAHPWTAQATVTHAVHEPANPIMKPFGAEFVIKDEIYEYYNWQPQSVRVLMSIDMSKTQIKRPYHVPVSWIRNWGEGRVYYNNLGHNDATWTNPAFMESVVTAIDWMQGNLTIDASPNPEISAKQEELAKQAVTPPAAPATPPAN